MPTTWPEAEIFNGSRALHWKLFQLPTGAYVEPTVFPTLRNIHYKLRVYAANEELWAFNTSDVSSDPGANGPRIDASATSNDTALLALSGLGKHRDIIMVAYFGGGEYDWKYRHHIALHLSNFGCGEKGMKTFVKFHSDEVRVSFGVGKGVTGFDTGCHGIFSIENGSLQFTQVPAF